MSNIWKQNKDVTQKVKRNNHDLSFDNHATFKMGYLYPVFRKAVVPGDSFRIRSAFDLKLMPLVFPLQTRLRAHLHFFYVRYKNVWKDFEDYMTGVHRNTPLVEPYLAPDDSKVKTGSIYDFLGVPTTLVSKNHITSKYIGVRGFSTDVKSIDSLGSYSVVGNTVTFYPDSSGAYNFVFLTDLPADFYLEDNYKSFDFTDFITYFSDILTLASEINIRAVNKVSMERYVLFDIDTDTSAVSPHVTGSYDLQAFLDTEPNFDDFYFILFLSNSDSVDRTFNWHEASEHITYSVDVPSGFSEYSDLNLNLYRDRLHLKAMPFRCYESIYRAYYANDILQPLIDSNGDAQYNKFCTTQEGGLDTTDYALFKRNYELDFLTSAYPSPQAGPAPLVGISALGNITIEDENGITTAKAEVDDDGHVTSVSITSPLASVEHGRTLVNIAQAGININDFRNANALQKFLEQTLRSGYRYIDFIRGQWGVKPKDQALDMPEFIGGFSREVVINTITSLADTGSDSLSNTLGGFGANGRVIGGSDFSINKFCDDYGEIIGVMCVTPTPAYSQLLDKSMIAGDNYLSFPFPQFNQLGMQPIPYKEVAPIQAYIDSLEDPDKSINDTFGYQRPNYNLVGSVDEVHGEFRGSLRQYLINRIFDGRPELASSFLEIDPSEVNDVFVNQSPDDDVLIGHLRFKVDTKRPFPRIHMPGL